MLERTMAAIYLHIHILIAAMGRSNSPLLLPGSATAPARAALRVFDRQR